MLMLSSLPAQDAWGAVSVATPDDLNAISSNPAGLGLSRGNQSGMYFPFNIDEEFAMHSANRMDGFGYSLQYNFYNFVSEFHKLIDIKN